MSTKIFAQASYLQASIFKRGKRVGLLSYSSSPKTSKKVNGGSFSLSIERRHARRLITGLFTNMPEEKTRALPPHRKALPPARK